MDAHLIESLPWEASSHPSITWEEIASALVHNINANLNKVFLSSQQQLEQMMRGKHLFLRTAYLIQTLDLAARERCFLSLKY